MRSGFVSRIPALRYGTVLANLDSEEPAGKMADRLTMSPQKGARNAKPLRIAVIGLGVAGGVVANGLAARADVELIAVEKVGPADHAHAGNGLNIGPNALRVLDATLPGLAASLRAAGLPWTQWRAALSDGRPLYRIALDEVADTPGLRIRWSELYRAIRAPLRQVARYRTQIADLAVAPGRKRGAISFTLLSEETGARERVEGIDLLIAADGRYSALREALCGTPVTRFLGVANFRTLLADGPASGIEDLEQWYTGPNRLLAFRLPDGAVYLSGNFPTDANNEVPESWKARDWLRAAYLPESGRVDPRCRWLIETLMRDGGALHWSRAQEIDMAFRDASGGVLFLGDSAHAMAPTLGQGATQAIEDACALLIALRHADPRALDIPAFTAAFEETRAGRVDFVRRFSWEASDTLLRGADPVAGNEAKAGAAYRAKLHRLYTEVPLP